MGDVYVEDTSFSLIFLSCQINLRFYLDQQPLSLDRISISVKFTLSENLDLLFTHILKKWLSQNLHISWLECCFSMCNNFVVYDDQE